MVPAIVDRVVVLNCLFDCGIFVRYIGITQKHMGTESFTRTIAKVF
jgi:hypothetical protein